MMNEGARAEEPFLPRGRRRHDPAREVVWMFGVPWRWDMTTERGADSFKTRVTATPLAPRDDMSIKMDKSPLNVQNNGQKDRPSRS
jgi:hypothetical protein